MVFFNRRPYERRSSEREVVNSNPGPPGPSTKVFKKSGEIMLAVKPLSQFRSLGRNIKPLALFSFILVLQLEGDVKEPVTLFEKSRGRRPRRQGLYI